MLTTKIAPFDLDIAAILDEEMSGPARSRALAAFAREQLTDAQATNAAALGRIPPHETIVDGGRGAREDTVRPDGTIVYLFELLEELFAWIAEQLVLHAPVLSGEFSRSFLFLADGVEVREGEPAPAASEYVFTNVQPYTRKLERGDSSQAPEGVFEAVAALAAARFGNVARISYAMRPLQAGALLRWAELRAPSKTGRTRRQRKAALARDIRQPSIVITLGR